MVCCSAIHDVLCMKYCFVTLARRSEMDWIFPRRFHFVGCARTVSLALCKIILKNPGECWQHLFKNDAMNLGCVVTFYEIKEKNLGKSSRHFGASFQMKCGWFCFYWISCEILSNFFLKINKVQQVTLLVMQNDTGISQFSQCSVPGYVLSLLSSLVFSPMASGEHPVDCTLRLFRQ